MTESPQDRPIDLGTYVRQSGRSRVTTTEIVAITLSVVWLLLVGGFLFTIDQHNNGAAFVNAVMTFLAVFLPIALIWVAATTARTVRELRGEAERLQGTVDAMRHAYVQQSQAQAAAKPGALERKLEEIAAAQRQTEVALAAIGGQRDGRVGLPFATQPRIGGPVVLPPEDEPALALGTPAEALNPPISVADYIRALNFPEHADDREGFRALRTALGDRSVSRLIRAAQDVLTLLAQDGIYMDDLRPERARPELWRKFAQGERGRTIAGIGGVRDRSSLALTSGRMRTDPVFRDAAHHFLRQFDKSFQEFEKTASDQQVVELAETRTARAFMLFGRVTGIFD